MTHHPASLLKPPPPPPPQWPIAPPHLHPCPARGPGVRPWPVCCTQRKRRQGWAVPPPFLPLPPGVGAGPPPRDPHPGPVPGFIRVNPCPHPCRPSHGHPSGRRRPARAQPGRQPRRGRPGGRGAGLGIPGGQRVAPARPRRPGRAADTTEPEAAVPAAQGGGFPEPPALQGQDAAGAVRPGGAHAVAALPALLPLPGGRGPQPRLPAGAGLRRRAHEAAGDVGAAGGAAGAVGADVRVLPLRVAGGHRPRQRVLLLLRAVLAGPGPGRLHLPLLPPGALHGPARPPLQAYALERRQRRPPSWIGVSRPPPPALHRLLLPVLSGRGVGPAALGHRALGAPGA